MDTSGRLAGSVAAALLALSSGTASAQESSDLIGLINTYRSASHACEGSRSASVGPLSAHPALAGVKAGSGRELQEALKERGYQAAQVQAITVSGPTRAVSVMKFIAQRYCRTFSSTRFTDIGVSHSPGTWHIVLARPLLAPDLGEWRAAGAEILRLTNSARASARACGGQRFGAAPPLEWAPALGAAALAHSRDMASRNYFSHRAKDGSQVGGRATREGYPWRSIGENIAAGQGSPAQVMASWLVSPTHCSNIMDRDFTQMGAAYALHDASDSTIYWTQVLGAPRQGRP